MMPGMIDPGPSDPSPIDASPIDASPIDPVTQDLVQDPRFPADDGVRAFESGGAELYGLLLTAAGPGPHPAVLLLHGFPGFSRNLDLAQAYRRAGFAVFVFSYRGAWGSGGEFRFGHVADDVRAALAFLRRPDVAGPARIDPERIALVGHSMGGFAGLLAGAADPGVRGVASLAGFDFGAFATERLGDTGARAELAAAWDAEARPLRGASGAALVEEVAANADAWTLRRLGPALAERRVLLVAAARDAVAGPELHHAPLLDALRAGGALAEEAVLDTDHSFTEARVALTRLTVDWLRATLA